MVNQVILLCSDGTSLGTTRCTEELPGSTGLRIVTGAPSYPSKDSSLVLLSICELYLLSGTQSRIVTSLIGPTFRTSSQKTSVDDHLVMGS